MANFYGKEISFLKLFGQQRWGECSPGRVTPQRIFHAAGIVIDRQGHIYVADTGNNRILGFRSYDSTGAKVILGQPTGFAGAPNGDCNLGTFGTPTRDSLCLLDVPGNANLGEQWQRLNFDVGADGDLYVPDVHNNRVLVFEKPFPPLRRNPAKAVIGQDDFTSNAINRGQPSCDDRSLFLTYDGNHVTGHGVAVDAENNVWVADPGNHRVLRFPKGGNVADLVLGQKHFDERVLNEDPANLERMCRPTIARVHPDGTLYVLDELPGFVGRILVFQPPFSNGMTPTELVPRFPDRGIMEPIYRAGFVFNPFRTKDETMVEGRQYREGILWLNDRWRTMLVAGDGTVLVSIAQARISGKEGQFLNFEEDFNLNWPGGSVGFDSANNIYIPDEMFHRVARYQLPYYPVPGPDGKLYPPPTNGGLFPGRRPNSVSNANFSGAGVGAITFGNQLIVRDALRYMVWEDYTEGTADVAGAPPATFLLEHPQLGITRTMHAIDRKRSRLWTISAWHTLMYFDLPLKSTHQPVMPSLVWATDGAPVNYHCDPALAYDERNDALWIFDRRHFRLLRVREIGPSFVVDAIIGQTNLKDGAINRGMAAPDAASLGIVNDIRFDRDGNLFVVDNTYECHENQRVIVFLAEDLARIQGIPTDIEARLVFVADSFTKPQTCGLDMPSFVDRPCSPVCVAFNNKGWMILGNDGAYSIPSQRHFTQLYIYRAPLERQDRPDGVIELPLGAPGEISFDDQDNLVVQDHIWSKVWVINLDRDPAWIRWL